MYRLQPLFCAAALFLFGGQRNLLAAEPPERLEIGVSESLMAGIPEWMRGVAADPFLKLIKANTNFTGHASFHPDGLAVGKALDDGKLHFGIFYGHEFAWAKAKYPKLNLLAVTKPTVPCQAFLLVKAESEAKTIADLAKQNLSLPPVMRPYMDMFLASQKKEHLKNGDFAKTVVAAAAVDAIYDVIEGRSGCTVVDAVALDFFETAYPGGFKRVKVLAKSEVFPGPCIAIKTDGVDPKSLEKIKATLLKADKLPGGEVLLRLWRCTGFEEPTEVYIKQCQKIGEKYQPAAPKGK